MLLELVGVALPNSHADMDMMINSMYSFCCCAFRWDTMQLRIHLNTAE